MVVSKRSRIPVVASSRWVVVCATELALAAGCGGQSFTDDDGTGSGGTGQAGSTGGSNSGGSGPQLTGGTGASGGSAGSAQSGGRAGAGRGGSNSAGSSSGAMPMAGSAGSGGSAGSTGGMPASGGASATGGASGEGGASPDVCSLPLFAGSCAAYFPRYGFDPALNRCVQFIYGGCDANANNFETFAACGAACGLPDESGCPAMMPLDGDPCMSLGHACDYQGYDSCLCQPVDTYLCESVDPNCPTALREPAPEAGGAGACEGPDCTSKVVIIEYMTCTCDASTWHCMPGSISGGGPR